MTDDFFNRDKLIEVIMYIKKSNDDWNWKTILINENSQVLLEFPNDVYIERCLFPANSDGYIYFHCEDNDYNEFYYVLDTNDTNGISSVTADQQGKSCCYRTETCRGCC